jgi:hypothetical protein
MNTKEKGLQWETPKHLSHKPIISVNNYEDIDVDKCVNGVTDAKALSIGRSQYDENQLALKVWRNNDDKWRRQSEELPISRNLDLSILFLAALSAEVSAPYSKSHFLREKIDDPDGNGVEEIKNYYRKNKEYLEPRLKELKRLLNEIVLSKTMITDGELTTNK